MVFSFKILMRKTEDGQVDDNSVGNMKRSRGVCDGARPEASLTTIKVWMTL